MSSHAGCLARVARRIAAAAAGLLAAAAVGPAAAQGLVQRPEVQRFLADMVDRHGFAPAELERLFAQARVQPSVLAAIAPQPPGTRSWRAYRANFVHPRRIEGGVQFWHTNAGALARAEREFGVPAEIIVAIIGIETEYGRNPGGYRVLDALATLAFDYLRRADYFRWELEQYLLLARESGLDARSTRGSFAGAIGIAQFMPGSIRRFAVDFDGDGRIDLRRSAADAIGSVASFLRAHGWVSGAPVALPARADGAVARAFADGGVTPAHHPEVLREAGIEFAYALPPDAPVVLIELETPGEPAVHLVGLQNFYALTRYNRSSFYAAAVLELAEAIKAGRPVR